MGRTFMSPRLGVRDVAERWTRSARALKKEDQKYGKELADMAKEHSSEAFVACNDPLEAATFSVLVEILRRQERLEAEMRTDVDP
jgi:hypothetical protein